MVYKVVMLLLNELTLQGVVVRQENHRRPAANMLERSVMLLRNSVDQVDSQSSLRVHKCCKSGTGLSLETLKQCLSSGSRIPEILKNTAH